MRLASACLVALCVLVGIPASAGHELSFYPSYYPQGIRIATHDPAAAAPLLEANTLHAYVGADPFAGTTPAASVASVDSLGGYLVLTFAPDGWKPEGRCAAARVAAGQIARTPGPFTAYPFPVTPYHPDYLAEYDRIQAARTAPVPSSAPDLRLRVVGPRAAAAARSHWPVAATGWTATLEDVDLRDLVAPAQTSANAWLGPPWLKAGWFHAYLLQRDAMLDPAARQAVDGLFRRLTTGQYAGDVERLELERGLVAGLGAGCERVVLGYATRREPYTAEFSAGIENVAADSQAGLDSAIFLRTAKLKDFPWNGWLTLGVPAGPSAAWNPIGGFTDPTGRLIWSALGDPAFFPAPRSGSWIGNRVTVASVGPASEVPKTARLPEVGSGVWREVGPGRAARTKIVYRVLASAFHDGTRMTPADTLYALSFAYRWSTPGGPGPDPAIAAATARLRDWLAGLEVVRVDTSEREFGEVKFTSVVQTVEAYGRYALADPQQTGSVMAPSTAVPWTVLVLMEEAVQRGLGAFSELEARRRGVPWLDLARDPKVRDRLAALLDELARDASFPAALKGQVTPAEVRERWTALRDFYAARKHFLVTNGPYRLESWSGGAVVLQVFRDLTYPLGVGSYDRYAIPRRAYPARAEVRAGRVEVEADVDVVQKFQREYRIVREPLRTADVDAPDTPVCRYVALAPDGRVVAAGEAPYAGRGRFAVELSRLPGPRPLTLLVLLTVRDNHVDPEVRMLTVGGP